ncbi:SURF1 family protein [soil metagenome]
MTRLRRRVARASVAALWVTMIVGLLALGTWQVHRLAWKLDLIARVEARLKASPVPAPATAGPGDAYRRISVTGHYLQGKDSFVQASTVRGPGWWVMTPLRANSGATILVNRGYVPERRAAPVAPGPLRVIGLLRLTEPGGGFLHHNDPAADRWYSRDVAAIAGKRGIGRVAPYFIDADAHDHGEAGLANEPIGGLTVVTFANNHLVYAITWYMLAAMTLAAFIFWLRSPRHRLVQ